MFWATNSQFPTVRAQSFPGTLTILNSALQPYPATPPVISVTGDGSQTNILSAGNFLANNIDAAALTAADQTSPPGQISQIINSNALGAYLPAITNDVVGTQPTPAFLENQLALQRTIDTTGAVAEPPGVTDVNLLRVFVSAGDNRVAVKIVGNLITPNAAPRAGMIEPFGSTSLVEVGTNYFLYPVGGSSGPELSYSGTPVVAGQFGAWTPIGAEQTANGYDVAWKETGADSYGVWATDSSGNYTSNSLDTVSGTSSALESLEPVFQQDLNGDSVLGDAITIDAGSTVELSSAFDGPVTFAGSTGTLQLDNSSSFSGTVAGISGQDTIDFVDINFASAQQPTYSGTNSGGTLTVTDGMDTANIALLDQYMAASFVTSPDGSGGTLVQDPPPATLAQTLTQPQHA
jgi:hypothetical protein